MILTLKMKLKLHFLAVVALSLFGCAGDPTPQVDLKPQQSQEEIAIEEALANPVCSPEFTQLTKEMFETCFPEGMTYVQVGNAIGHPGELSVETEDSQIYLFQGISHHGGSASFVFTDGKLVSKTQINLTN